MSTITPKQGMKKYIRLRGLLGFVGLMLAITLITYMFAESLIKSGIERSAGAAFGAEVNVASVNLTYTPFILTVNGFEVTDAESPSLNLFSFKTASAGIDFWQYLLGKTIVEELTVSDLTFATKRTRVGEVYKENEAHPTIDNAKSVLPTIDLSLPDVSTLLDDSNLLTVKASKQLEQSYKEEQERLLKIKANLPDKSKLEVYKQRIKAIGKMKVKTLEDFNKVKLAFDELKAEFKNDQLLVKSAKNQLEKSKKRLSEDAKQLKNSPNQDWKIIENKYQLNSVSNDDFAHILFGDKARGYYQTAEKVYEKVKPFLVEYNESSAKQDQEQEAKDKLATKGRFIYFKEENALPPFLIKHIKLSVVTPGTNSTGNDDSEKFDISINELTSEHWHRGNPTTMVISSALKATGSITSNSKLYRQVNGGIDASGLWEINDIALSNVELSKASGLTLLLTNGFLSGKGDFSISNSKTVSSKNDFVVTSASYSGEAKSKFAKLLLDTFKALDNLTLHIGVKGDVKAPDFKMSSSLDEAMKVAFKKQITNKLASFKHDVNKGLNDKLAKSLKLNQADTQDLIDLEKLLTDTDNALENLKHSDVVKQQKKKLKNKAADKLKDKLKNLFN